MISFFTTTVYEPLLNLLIFLYHTAAFQDLGVAIIFLTFIIRLILFPVFQKGLEYQALMQKIQPELKRVQEEYKNDKEKQLKEVLDLYKRNKLNPFASFVPLLIQLPILISLYHISITILQPGGLEGLYSFVQLPEATELSKPFLGLINLGSPSIVIVLLATLAQYFQLQLAFQARPKAGLSRQEEMSQRFTMMVGVGLPVIFLMALPAAAGVYWFATSLFSVGQQYLVNKKLSDGKLGSVS